MNARHKKRSPVHSPRVSLTLERLHNRVGHLVGESSRRRRRRRRRVRLGACALERSRGSCGSGSALLLKEAHGGDEAVGGGVDVGGETRRRRLQLTGARCQRRSIDARRRRLGRHARDDVRDACTLATQLVGERGDGGAFTGGTTECLVERRLCDGERGRLRGEG